MQFAQNASLRNGHPGKLSARLQTSRTPWNDPSLSLVPIDEAFSKMDTGRIKDGIEAIKALDMQGTFSMSTGNVPAAFSLCDRLIVVSRQEERRGNRPAGIGCCRYWWPIGCWIREASGAYIGIPTEKVLAANARDRPAGATWWARRAGD